MGEGVSYWVDEFVNIPAPVWLAMDFGKLESRVVDAMSPVHQELLWNQPPTEGDSLVDWDKWLKFYWDPYKNVK